MRRCIRITEGDLTRLEEYLAAAPGQESAAFLLAGLKESEGEFTLLVRRVVEIPAEDYVVRTRHRIELSTRAINGLAALCEANGLLAILAHSHPDPIPYSASDDHGEARIASTLRHFMPRPEVGSLLFTPGRIYGRVWNRSKEAATAVEELIVLGRAIRRVCLNETPRTTAAPPTEIRTRQVLAFGEVGQRALADQKVGIVGTGGTGSALAEQLARLGTDDLVVVDRGPFEASNLSRVYGSRVQ